MGIKLSFLHKHLPNLPENFGEVIDEQCEQCQHDLEVKKKNWGHFFFRKNLGSFDSEAKSCQNLGSNIPQRQLFPPVIYRALSLLN